MVLYREKKRKSPWLWVGVIVAFLAAVAAIVVVLNLASGSSDDEKLADAVLAMTSQLDVLQVSHYTDETLSEGPESPEYQAALDDLERIRGEWDSVKGSVPAETATEIQGLLDGLDQAVRGLAPVLQVRDSVESLIKLLSTI